jgi:hypothetical protein
MADTPQERRRRARESRAASPPQDEAEPTSGAPSRSSVPGGITRRLGRRSVVWPLATGLAIGFAFGREAYRFGLSDTRPSSAAGEGSTAFIAADNAPNAPKAYAHESDFPAGWVKDSDLGDNTKLFAGLSEAQKTTVMTALNSRNCECGCSFGTLAQCLQKDPNCPRSPAMTKLAVDLVKQGKSLSDILAAIDAKQKDMGGSAKPAAAAPEPPSTPHYVELAAWNPRKGPRAAKVTLVEFSDFQ